MIALAALVAAACGGCHAREAEAFAASRHARAAEAPAFRASLLRARTGACLGCHRPDGKGLSCGSCHGGADAPEGACAGCHEFALPAGVQTTVSEAGARACSGCHDPHRAAGGHDPATLDAALRFEPRAVSGGVEIVARVPAGASAHAVPTGNPFRRVVVSVCADEACAAPIARETLARRFVWRDGRWIAVADRRLREGEARVLRFPPAAFWRAELRFVDPALEAGLPADEVARLLGGGRLPTGR